MPIIPEENVKPTYVAQPDMRFATTFLSTKYRQYSVKGEALMDKESGELFMKRKSDGKVVSFFQNKKYINDVVLELRVLLTNNENMTYPINNENAYFLSTNYDLTTINNETITDISIDNIVIPGTPDNFNKLTFSLSKDSNGFFTMVNTRDCDKPIVEYLTNQYNVLFENYSGDVQEYKEEKKKFQEEKWKDSNATLYFTVTVNFGEITKTYESKDHIRLNESVSVYIPYDKIVLDFPDGIDSYEISIQKIEFHKIQYMLQKKDTFGDKFLETVNRFMHSDNMIQSQSMNVLSFIDEAYDFILLGNETIVAIADVPYIKRHMSKLAKLKNSSQFILSVKRPDDMEWGANTLWAEWIREIQKNGIIIKKDSETDFKRLEQYISSNGNLISGEIVKNEDLIDDFLLTDLL